MWACSASVAACAGGAAAAGSTAPLSGCGSQQQLGAAFLAVCNNCRCRHPGWDPTPPRAHLLVPPQLEQRVGAVAVERGNELRVCTSGATPAWFRRHPRRRQRCRVALQRRLVPTGVHVRVALLFQRRRWPARCVGRRARLGGGAALPVAAAAVPNHPQVQQLLIIAALALFRMHALDLRATSRLRCRIGSAASWCCGGGRAAASGANFARKPLHLIIIVIHLLLHPSPRSRACRWCCATAAAVAAAAVQTQVAELCSCLAARLLLLQRLGICQRLLLGRCLRLRRWRF